MPPTFLSDFTPKLSRLPGNDLSSQLATKACVALILRGGSKEDLELGFIQRAVSPNDGWSGQLAFPGGRSEDSDEDDFYTACREVREEIGVELAREEFLGHIDDIQARRRGGLLNFFIRPLVFHIDREVAIVPDPSEVADFFWVPIATLRDPARFTELEWEDEGKIRKVPAIDVGRTIPLWGLSHLMTADLLSRL